MSESPAAQALLDVFGRIVVISLPDRADRRREIEAELRKAGLSLSHPGVELFTAIRPRGPDGFPTTGAHGAFLSHLAVMERLLAQGWERVLVLEDDMDFAPGALERLPALAAALQARDWVMLYGHPGEGGGGPAPDADGLIALPADRMLIQLHFLGLTRRMAEIAVPELRAMLARPPGSPEGGPMHVDGALNWIRSFRPELAVLAVAPALAVQRASRSDIAPPRWFDRLPLLRGAAGLWRRLRRGGAA